MLPLNLTSINELNSSASDELKPNSWSNTCSVELWPGFWLERDLWVYLGCIAIAVGSLGHPITVVVIVSNRSMRRLPLSIHLIAMATSGLLTLYAGLLPVVVDYQSCFQVSLKDITTLFGCQLLAMLADCSLQVYSWSEALFSVERLIATRWPLKYHEICSLRRNVIISCATSGSLILINVFHFFTHGYDDYGFCEPIDIFLYDKVWRYVHLCLYAVFPVIVMVCSNAVTIQALRSSAFPSSAKLKAESSTVMMMSMNVIFVLTTIPDMVLEWKDVDMVSFDTIGVAVIVCRLVKYIGSACSVFIYVAAGRKFRAAAKAMICKKPTYPAHSTTASFTYYQSRTAPIFTLGDAAGT